MITATRRIQFCAGHRVFLHESKCANMHGHNYVAHIEAMASNVQDELGRVVDFSVLKEKVGGWIEKYWDHGFIFYREDAIVRELFQPGGPMDSNKAFMLPENPTAENMAKFLLLEVCPVLFEGTRVRVIRVTLEETENCKVDVTFTGGVDGYEAQRNSILAEEL